MARQIRIEYPGAFYHVFSRGNQKQPIFLNDEDRHFFLKCLREAHEKFGVVIHAYCLMPNHFHLVLETPLGNLSRMMHFLITSYTIYFNKKHKRHGHLFQGRFRSVLVEAVLYAQELSRYVHLNPVRAELVERPEEYPWSSYQRYRGKRRPESWLETNVILGLYGDRLEEARMRYLDYVARGISEDLSAPIRGSVRSGILGSEAFIEKIKRERLGGDCGRPDREKPQLRKLRKAPDIRQFLSISKRFLGPKNRMTVPIAIWISHKCTDMKLKEIGEAFALSISGVSNACSRAREAIAQNAPLAKAAEEIEHEAREALKQLV